MKMASTRRSGAGRKTLPSSEKTVRMTHTFPPSVSAYLRQHSNASRLLSQLVEQQPDYADFCGFNAAFFKKNQTPED